jgi:pimeloyl-ACP methyl ester carboxylesterase
MAQGGKEAAETILLLCPLPQSIVAFEPIWHLLQDDYRLIALDIPGFGGSEGGAEFMTFEAQGRFLNSFVKEMGISDFHIIGPDVGMAAALHYVTHYEHKARSLMIGDGPGVAPSLNGSVINKCVNSSFWRLVFTIAGAGPFVHAGNQLAAVNYQLTKAEVQDYVDSYKHRIPAILEWFKGYPDSLASVDPLLEKIDIPVKVFWGELDQFLFVENARTLAKRLKRSDVQIFSNAGHYVYQDASGPFADMVRDWVNGGYKSI